MTIEVLPKSEYVFARELLSKLDLPSSDIEQEHLSLYKISEDKEVFGIGGIERYGKDAILRSMAIKEGAQGKGIGSKLTDQLEAMAKKEGIHRFFLLTTTAERFFNKHGYHLVERSLAPESMQQSTEFSSLCPSTASCMMKEL